MKLVDHLNLVELANKEPIKYLASPSFQERFKKWLKKVSLFLLIIFLLLIATFFVYQRSYAGQVYPGISLGQFKLGGLTAEQVRQFLKPVVDQVENQGLVFKAQSEKGNKKIAVKPVLIALSDPDLSRRVITFDLDATIDQAMAIGRQGSWLEQIKEIVAAQSNNYYLKAVVQVDEQEIKNNLQDNFQSLEQDSHDAGFEISKKGEFKIVPDQAGYYFDFDQALAQAKNNLLQLTIEPIDLKIVNFEPTVKAADVEQMKSKIMEALDLAPLTLAYQQDKWPVNKNLLSQWLVVKKNQQGEVELAFDPDKIALYLNILGKDINQEALDAKFKMEGERVVEFQPSKAGQKLQVDDSIQEIVKQVLSGANEVNLIVESTAPQVLTQEVNDLGIKELIGRGTSNFAGSPKNRRHNIAVGAQKLNGLLIKPGEEFSLLKALGNVDEAAGFLPELVIKGDRTIPEFGGGLCQIGTTTFRVALYSGLPITARTPHSYRVVYYEPAGMDATIYNPQPDLKFINDTGAYILFETKIEGDSLIFEFYGTLDGRKVDITKPTLSNITPHGPPLEIKTLDLKPGEKKKIESAHNGADAEFSRTITYADGTTKTNIWKSHYRPWQEVWLVGVASLDETTTPAPEQMQQP